MQRGTADCLSCTTAFFFNTEFTKFMRSFTKNNGNIIIFIDTTWEIYSIS